MKHFQLKSVLTKNPFFSVVGGFTDLIFFLPESNAIDLSNGTLLNKITAPEGRSCYAEMSRYQVFHVCSFVFTCSWHPVSWSSPPMTGTAGIALWLVNYHHNKIGSTCLMAGIIIIQRCQTIIIKNCFLDFAFKNQPISVNLSIIIHFLRLHVFNLIDSKFYYLIYLPNVTLQGNVR